MPGQKAGSRSAAVPTTLLLCLLAAGCGSTDERDEQSSARTITAETAVGDVAWFQEVQGRAGLAFLHRHGGTGRKYFVETMGSGAGLFDYDNDGWLDAYLVQSGPVPGTSSDSSLDNQLFRNRGDGTFENVTRGSGAGDAGYGMGVAFGDYNSDGFSDIFITNFGPNQMYRNLGDGTFANVTAAAGLGDGRWGAGAAFADYDLDGDLDLYVVNYLSYSIDNNIRCGPPGVLAYCHPDVYPGSPDILYRNDGGVFTDVSRPAGISTVDPSQAKGLGVVWLDYDQDGDPDIYVTNDSTPNFLYRNNGDGTFADVALEAGVAFNRFGKTEAGMGIAAGDYDWNGHVDLFMTHLDEETNTLYHNLGRGLFQDYSAQSRLGTPSLKFVGFGTGMHDFDNDGWLDVFVANGHILEAVEQIKPGSGVAYAQRDLLFKNDGTGRFREIGSEGGAYFNTQMVGRGTAFGDIDNDGDIDVLVSNSNQKAILLENLVGHTREWIGFRLRGGGGNPEAIGARVAIQSAGLDRWQEVRSGGSYLSQNDLRIVFGLGDGRSLERLRVTWPDGKTDDLAADLSSGVYHNIERIR